MKHDSGVRVPCAPGQCKHPVACSGTPDKCEAAQPTVTLTIHQARFLLDALDTGLGHTMSEAERFHDAMKGYREAEHQRLDGEAATVNAAITLLGQIIEAADESGVKEGS